ncbi:MAG TPA: xylose isomerase [Phycisphaerales bacterium]|nr:xylose isomerase [Phycisphaerales bacterium]|tara:strand:+ start:52214 stop:53062 length:849 start_codon:yes stop_codon:yes gene_type:complete
MIKSISYWALEHGLAGTHPVDQALADADKAGFEALELAVGTEGAFHVDSNASECQKIAKLIEQSSIEVPTVAAGLSWGCNPVSNDADTRKQSIELHAKALQRTADVGAKAMLMVPGVVSGPMSGGKHVRYDLAMQRVTEAVEQLLPLAEKVGVDLCLENVWNGMFYSPTELASFIDSFTSNRLGVYFDVGNVLGYHQYPPHWIELLGKRIKRVHIKDYAENFGFVGGYTFCSLGAGQVPWAESIAALKAIGYDQTLVAEMLPWNPGLLERTRLEMDRIIALA